MDEAAADFVDPFTSGAVPRDAKLPAAISLDGPGGYDEEDEEEMDVAAADFLDPFVAKPTGNEEAVARRPPGEEMNKTVTTCLGQANVNGHHENKTGAALTLECDNIEEEDDVDAAAADALDPFMT